MLEYKVEEILKGLLNREADVLNFIYESYFYQIKTFVSQNSGTIEDARDIYQDAILVIYQKLKKGNLALTCSFNTYLYSVSRLLWLKHLERNRRINNFIEESGKFVELGEEIVDLQEMNDRYKLYQDHFKKLGYSCQKILELFFARIPMKDIARILGFKSEQYVKKRKHQCKEKLVNNIRRDARYNGLTPN